MALQVWLPLNGNLNNQGLNKMTFSNSNGSSTIIVDNNGKIGKCYNRSSIQSAGRIISNSTINLNGDLSMFCWAKVTKCVGDTANGLVSNHSHSNNTGFGITVKQVSTTDFRISCNTGNGSSRTYMTYYGTTNIKDKWYHLGLTYDNTKHEFKLWVDGICEKTVSYTNSSIDDYIMVFDWSTTYSSNNYKPSCLINDVRIYDHCLSPKEVKELSKGLVLHYKLTEGCENNILPYGVELYDYIQNTGTQWIDTEITANETSEIECKFNNLYYTTNINDSRSNHIFGAANKYTSNAFEFSANYGFSTYGSTSNYISFDVTTGIHIILKKQSQTYLDGILKGTSNSTTVFTTPYTVKLFAFHRSNTFIINAGTKIYYYKHINNGVLVRNLLPCTFLGEPGMWDTVENKFYRNQGTGQFTLGNKINLKEYEYLESDGSSYINTGIPYDSTKTSYKIESKFSQPNNINSYDGVFGAYTDETHKTLRIIRGSSNNRMWSYYNIKAGGGNPVTMNTSNANIKEVVLTSSQIIVNENGTTTTYPQQGTTATDTTSIFYLFCQGDSNGNVSILSKSRIYYFKFYDNNQLIKEFIPITYNDIPGLWDKVELKFYANNGSGNFILGPEKTISKIYDCSGYKNDGTVTGNLQINSDSLRYNYCTSFDGSSYISGPVLQGIAQTAAFWLFVPSTIPGTGIVFLDRGSMLAFGYWSSGNIMVVACTTSCKSVYSTSYLIKNSWNHVVIIRPTGSSDPTLYINGKLVANNGNSDCWAGSESEFTIGNRITYTSYPFTGKINDFRLYATVLSEDDIKDLYNIAGSIDNQGDMFSFEFGEDETNKQQILKTGITKINNFIEVNDKIKVLYDGSVFLQLLHHNNPSSNLFTSTNCWFNNTTNLYSSIILLKTLFKNLTEYEFLVCENLESSGKESQIRWKQTSNPAIATTATGYQLISGSSSYLSPGLVADTGHGCFDMNGSSWWCCCGCYVAYSGGIPGFTGVVKSGYLDLYIRIPEDVLKGNVGDNLKIFKKSILSTQFIEK